MEKKKRIKARNDLVIIGILFCSAAALSLYLNISKVRAQYEELALHIGRSYLQTFIATRQWNAEHTGVYVPMLGDVRPNPYLEDPLRDVVTTEGLKLTKINPAYMTRLTSEILAREKGVQLHLTSLKPINPRNTPDEWEEQVLGDFNKGLSERYGLTGSGSTTVFRYMAPLRTEEACLKCHAKHGYAVGDIRGGISISFLYEPFQKAVHTNSTQAVITHLFFLCISLMIIFVLGRHIIGGIRQLQESLLHIKKLEGFLPICSRCKKMRREGTDPRDKKSWVPVEQYITEKTDAAFTHSICPECAAQLYSDTE